MGDTQVRHPVACHSEKGVDFGRIIHKSPSMAELKDPVVLSNYVFQPLEVNPGVAAFWIQLPAEDVEAVVESVTAHAEKGAGTKATLYVGQEEAEDVEEEAEEVEQVGGGSRKDKLQHPLMISVQKVRVRPGKGKAKTNGWFPPHLTTTSAGCALRTPEASSPCILFAPQGGGSVSGMESRLPTLIRGRG